MKKKTASTVLPSETQNPPENYEKAMEELSVLVAQMESGQLPLEAMLSQHQRGTYLLQYCQSQLEVLEKQIQVLESSKKSSSSSLS